MEAWDTIVIGDGPAALRAASAAAKAGATTLMMSADSLGSGNTIALDGIAAPLKESTINSHRNDTIKAGNFLCDQDIVSVRVSQAIRQVDLLERWGVIFRRDADGIPLVRRAAGHTLPRLAGAGDAMVRETQQVLEEQCMRHGVVRRGDQIPLDLIHTNQQVNGIVCLDMTTGTINALQAKSVIIADGGFEGIWNGTSVGLGLDLAFRAGLPIRDMEFVGLSPLSVEGSNVVIPLGILADGATIHHTNGSPLEVDDFADVNTLAESMGEEKVVLDARNIGASKDWWAQTSELLQTRLGINMDRQTIPISVKVGSTLGGIATDEHSRAVSGKWSRWFTGLYAAGDSACSGLHGSGTIAGNRLLDALAGAFAAGEHAAEFSRKAKFSGRAALEAALGKAEADIDIDLSPAESGPVQRTGAIFAKLADIANSNLGFVRDKSGLEAAVEQLEKLELDLENLHIDDNSRLYNSNLLEALRLKAGVRLAKAMAQSALARTESRGTHKRSDFAELDPEQLHHNLVDIQGNISQLAIRKGSSGDWILSPE